MWNIISYIKEIIIWSLPFLFLHIYLKNVYQISFGQLLVWWFKNFTSADSSTAISISFILIFLLFCLPLTSLMNSFYLGLFGEKQTLVYLGNPSSSISMYYNISDISKRPFQGYNIDQKYNFKFTNLNKLKYFIKDPGTNNIVGQKNIRLHATAITSTFFFMIFFLLPVLGAIHAFSYPMYIDLHGETTHLKGDVMKAFEIVLLDFKISKGLSALILFGGLILAMYFGGRMPDETSSLAVTPIPGFIKEGASIKGIPVEINIRYEEVKNNDGTTSTHDSGFRYVIFRFDKGFNPSVYLTLYFDLENYPSLEDRIKSNIASKTEMPLAINEDLGVRLEYKLSLN